MRTFKISLLVFFLSITISAQNFWFPTGGPNGVNLYHMKIDSIGLLYVIERPQDIRNIYRSTNNGINWDLFTSGSDITFDKNGYYYKIDNSLAYRSIDGGNTWVEIYNSTSGDSQIEVDSRGDILICDEYNLVISTDFGNNWDQIFTGKKLSITNEDHFYVGRSYDMWRSTDYGTTWEQILGISQPYYVKLNSLGHIFALSWGNGIIQKIYKSTDDAITWDSVFTSDDSITEIFISKNDQLYVAVRSEGIYRSINSGENWEIVNSGLINYFNYGVVEDNYSHLYVSTFGDGIFKSVSPISELEEEDNGQHNFALYNNYPNPFNPVTKIKYTIPTPPITSPLVKGRTEEGFVTLKVYDILGREVATLVNEEKPAGEYEVEFNATILTSGIYFYQLKAGEFTETRKMVLIK